MHLNGAADGGAEDWETAEAEILPSTCHVNGSAPHGTRVLQGMSLDPLNSSAKVHLKYAHVQ